MRRNNRIIGLTYQSLTQSNRVTRLGEARRRLNKSPLMGATTRKRPTLSTAKPLRYHTAIYELSGCYPLSYPLVSLWLSQCAIAIRQAPAYALARHSSAHRGLSSGKARAILGRFAQHMRNRAHARLSIAGARTRSTTLGYRQAIADPPSTTPDGGKRGVESQGRPRVSITKFECSFTRAGLGGPWAIPRLYLCHPWLLRGFASAIRHYPITSLCIRYVVPRQSSLSLLCCTQLARHRIHLPHPALPDTGADFVTSYRAVIAIVTFH